MPFKSKAQRRKFAELLVEGKITDEAYERWNQTTGRKKLPERVAPEKDAKKKRATRKRATARAVSRGSGARGSGRRPRAKAAKPR